MHELSRNAPESSPSEAATAVVLCDTATVADFVPPANGYQVADVLVLSSSTRTRSLENANPPEEGLLAPGRGGNPGGDTGGHDKLEDANNNYSEECASRTGSSYVDVSAHADVGPTSSFGGGSIPYHEAAEQGPPGTNYKTNMTTGELSSSVSNCSPSSRRKIIVDPPSRSESSSTFRGAGLSAGVVDLGGQQDQPRLRTRSGEEVGDDAMHPAGGAVSSSSNGSFYLPPSISAGSLQQPLASVGPPGGPPGSAAPVVGLFDYATGSSSSARVVQEITYYKVNPDEARFIRRASADRMQLEHWIQEHCKQPSVASGATPQHDATPLEDKRMNSLSGTSLTVSQPNTLYGAVQQPASGGFSDPASATRIRPCADNEGMGSATNFNDPLQVCENLDNIVALLSSTLPEVHATMRDARIREQKLEKENAHLKTAVDKLKTQILRLERQIKRERDSKSREIAEIERMYESLHNEHEKTVDQLQMTQQVAAITVEGGAPDSPQFMRKHNTTSAQA
ncbi:unnamed protein product [Amoebophrya sp. A25]|nr:unnamed protein product [Amoebophrya sp. A25]|eukprot:GSA25T00016672001.1